MRAWPAVVDRAGAALDRLAELAREGVDVPGLLEREDEVDGLETTPTDELCEADGKRLLFCAFPARSPNGLPARCVTLGQWYGDPPRPDKCGEPGATVLSDRNDDEHEGE